MLLVFEHLAFTKQLRRAARHVLQGCRSGFSASFRVRSLGEETPHEGLVLTFRDAVKPSPAKLVGPGTAVQKREAELETKCGAKKGTEELEGHQAGKNKYVRAQIGAPQTWLWL